jgi:hypothetical protein
VGDEWRFTTGLRRVIAVEENQVVQEIPTNRSCSDCRYYYDGSGTLTKVVDKNGAPVNNSGIGIRYLDFPISVGKEWSQTTNWFNERSNRNFPLKHVFRVEGYEEVTTKAGTFKSFKILHSRERQSSFNNLQGRDGGRAILWYSPDVRTFVKRQALSAGFGNDFELESHSLK